MNHWTRLRDTINVARTELHKDWTNALTVHLRRAVVMGVCATFEPFRLKKSGRVIELAKRGAVTMKTRKSEVPAIALENLPSLDDAKLALRVVLKDDEKRIEQYTMTVLGNEKLSARPWYARVDLDAEQKGQGPCSHAMLHIHVGVDPNEGGHESRVPAPWLAPDDALIWLLATVDPRLEP